MSEWKPQMIDFRWRDGQYRCSEPGDRSGEYVSVDNYRARVAEFEAEVERLRGPRATDLDANEDTRCGHCGRELHRRLLYCSVECQERDERAIKVSCERRKRIAELEAEVGELRSQLAAERLVRRECEGMLADIERELGATPCGDETSLDCAGRIVKELAAERQRAESAEARVAELEAALQDEVIFAGRENKAKLAAEAERDSLRNLFGRVKLEAQIHSGEARCQTDTIHKVIQAGKPGMADWQDIPGMVAALRSERDSALAVIAAVAAWIDDFVERLEGEAIGAASKIVDLEDEVATLKRGNRDYARMIAEFEERSKPVADRGKVTQH